ncbi:MAG: ATP-binding protein [Deltaproteobacteria bacterium]|nr:MAG: ATP-binding protein [Deltaproteobacteria bacterium]
MAKERWTTRTLRDALLGGLQPDADLVRALIQQQLKEDYLFDWKVGEALENDRGGHNTDAIREYVTGFANGDGGVVIIGVADPAAAEGGKYRPWSLAGCPKPPPNGYRAWVASALADQRPFLQPAPRVETVEVDGHLVLIVAVARAPGLVPVTVKKKGTGYYLRFGDGFHWMPPYLKADLLLGRQTRPSLEVVTYYRDAEIRIEPEEDRLYLKLGVQLKNVGLTWVERSRVGVVFPGAPRENSDTQTLTEHHQLRSWIRSVEETAGHSWETPAISYYEFVEAKPSSDMSPFQDSQPRGTAQTWLRRALDATPRSFDLHVYAGVWVTTPHGLPAWWQLRLHLEADDAVLQRLRTGTGPWHRGFSPSHSLRPCAPGERPLVGVVPSSWTDPSLIGPAAEDT